IDFTFNVTRVPAPLAPPLVFNCSIFIDGVLNKTNDSTAKATTTNFTVEGLTVGDHNWTVDCVEVPGSHHTNATFRNFTIDDGVDDPPTVTLNAPTDGASLTSTPINLTYTPADDVSSTLNCSLYINDTLNVSDISVAVGVLDNFTLQSLDIGSYNWTVQCTDELLNSTNSTTNTFTYSWIVLIDFTLPTPSDAIGSANRNQEINISTNTSDLETFTWNWNGTNYSIYDSSLVLMFNFDNVSALNENDTYIVDVSQYANNGTPTGATWTSNGKYNGAYNFSGSGQYISVPDASSLDPASAISIGFWIRVPTAVGNDNAGIIHKGSFSDDQGRYAVLFNSVDPTVRFRLNNADGQVIAPSPLIIDTWYYYVADYDGATMRLYENGNEVAAQAYSTPISTDTEDLHLGCYFSTAYCFNGNLDDVQIHNRSLSADEIKQQYYSNLYKYVTTNWQFYSNQSNLSETTYSYYACANDTLGNENCTATRTITIIPIVTGNSETDNLSEWRMFGRYLNHTKWDGIDFPIIPGLNTANFTTNSAVSSSPVVANGYVYIGSNDYSVYQLNASNVSQQIANFTTGNMILSSVAVAGDYIYVGSFDNILYQLNASNISQQIANFTTGSSIYSVSAIADGYVYTASEDSKVYQLNASNVSQQITNFTASSSIESSPAIANGYVYIGDNGGIVHQLNASNVSQQITNFTTGGAVLSSPAVANGYV
ncbi:PQQ-binding-like beta-propeller repeat protein, partial [Candidatus Micrarchaeota archaeon]|nr:PQQ-binding-like beta-propeller repeat protein [Candidatus Micrarchaeota archaeon]